MATLEDVLASIDANAQGALDRLFELVRIPSISAQAQHFPDCERAADWLTAQLTELGFEELRDVLSGRCNRSTISIRSSLLSRSKSLRFIRFLNQQIPDTASPAACAGIGAG